MAIENDKCSACGGEMVSKHGNFEIEFDGYGTCVVNNSVWDECSECRLVVLSMILNNEIEEWLTSNGWRR